jgi:hypothetical protein
MRPLKPFTTFAAGSLVLAAVFGAVTLIAHPDRSTLRDLGVASAIGLLLGAPLFGAIAAGMVCPSQRVRRHFEQMERWSSILMAMGLGHWFSLQLGEYGTFVALALVFIGACFRIFLHGVAKRLV